MTWSQELVKIRRMLRDPDAGIWSDAFLLHLYNDCQRDFQNKTAVLEEAVAQRVPAVYQMTYLQDWEYRYLPADQSQFYQALGLHDDGVFCHRWEPQQVTGLNADVADVGAHFTQPWESYMDTPGEPLKMRWPQNFHHVKFIAYDEEPIGAVTKKHVQSLDQSYITHEGDPIAYYPYDEVENAYVLYPRPSASFDNELSGEGMALFADGDTEDTSSGTIATRSGSYDDGQGVAIDVVDVVNSVFLVYAVSPTEIQSGPDEPDFPEFLRKYVRYAVIARAYGGNNDGRIRTLSDFWFQRYQLGIQFVRRYHRNRRHDRDYRLTTKGATPKRTVRHPRMPDHYPVTNP
jgi:hypothetical protein